MVDLLCRLVEAESPSFNPGAHGRAVAVLEEALGSAGCATRRVGGNATGCHLSARPEARIRGTPYQLVVGHLDTAGRSEPSNAARRGSSTASSTGPAPSTPRAVWCSSCTRRMPEAVRRKA